MARYIDWYLVELEKKMAPGHSIVLIHEAVSEAREHLEAIASEYQEQGMSLDAAERSAVERFGGVEGMVETVAPEPKFQQNHGNWKPAALFLALGYALMGVAVGVSDPHLFLGFCAGGGATLFISALACLRSGKLPVSRFLLMHVVGVAMVAYALGTSTIAIGSGYIRRADASEASKHIAAYAANLQQDEAFLTSSLLAYRANDRDKIESDNRLFVRAGQPDDDAPRAMGRWVGGEPSPAGVSGYWIPESINLPSAWEVGMNRPYVHSSFMFGDWERKTDYVSARKWWLRYGHDKLQIIREARRSLDDWNAQLAMRGPVNEAVVANAAAAGLAIMVLWFLIAFTLNGIGNATASVMPRREKRSIA